MYPHSFGRYDYGPPPSITSMYAPRDNGSMYSPRHNASDPYFASHPGAVAFMQPSDNDHSHGHHHPAAVVPRAAAYLMGDNAHPMHQHHHPAVPRATATAFRQHSSLSSGLGRTMPHPVPDRHSDNPTSTARPADCGNLWATLSVGSRAPPWGAAAGGYHSFLGQCRSWKHQTQSHRVK